MAETLIFRITGKDEQVDWVVTDDAGAAVSAGKAPLEEIAAQCEGRRVIAIAPAEKVLRVAVNIPLKGAAKIRQAIPFALEEQLAGDIDTQHFGFSKANAAGLIPVAVIEDGLLADWLDRCAAADVHVDAFYSASDGVPATPATISLLIDDYGTVIRDQLGEFTVTDTATMPMMLEMLLDQHAASMENNASAVPVNLIVYCDEATHNDHESLWARLRMRAETVETKIISGPPLAFIANQIRQNDSVNLLQGAYAPKSEINIQWGPWRVPAALAGGLIILVLLLQGANYWQLSREEAALDAAATQILQQTFPDAAETNDPWGTLQARLGAAGGTQTAAGGPGFAEAMDALAGAISQTPEIKMRTLGYRSGIVDLQLVAPSVDALDKLRQQIADSGKFDATIQSANPDDDVIKGRMQITVTEQ
jgi:general secretion pathway protein L